MINTLMYARKLERAGLSREQAEAHVQILAEVIGEDLTTKQDLQHLEARMTIKMGAMVIASTTIIIAVLAVLLKT